MKKLLLFLSVFCVAISIQAQVFKTVSLTSAGTLGTVLTADEKNTITNLSLSGSINGDDLSTIVQMKALKVIDMGETNGITNVSSRFRDNKLIEELILPKLITIIDVYAFSGCSALKKIVIPESVTTISESAFENCSALTTINIPNAITRIYSRTFYGCASLRTLELPSSLTQIGASAFSGCTLLKNITIPASVSSIDSYAFSSCKSLQSISIPASVKIIDWWTFHYCDSLVSVSLPNGLTSIGENAFCGTRLSSVILPNTLTTIEGFAFNNCIYLKSIVIPSSVTTIGESAFSDCGALETIVIGSSAANIGSSAFSQCKAVKSIKSWRSTPADLSSSPSVFSGITRTIPLTVPYGSKSLYDAANQWTNFVNIYEGMYEVLSVSSVYENMSSKTTSTVLLTTEAAWTASTDAAWITVNPATGTGSANMTITASPNTGIARSADITIVSGTATKKITVSQAASANAPIIALSNSAKTISSAAGIVSVNVTANIAWSASSDQTWLSVSPANGTNDGTINLSFTANTGASRVAKVSVSGTGATPKIVTLTQDAGSTPPVISVSKTDASLPSTASTTSFTVSSNTSWTATSDQTWLTLSSASGTNDGTITLSATANTGASRSATISLSASGATAQTITVTQAAGKNTSVVESSAMEINVYPNPANSDVTIIGIGIEYTQLLLLTDYNGVNHCVPVMHASTTAIKFLVKGLAAGLYSVQVPTEGGVQVVKLIVE